jgi:hypothetical protein
MHTQMKLFDTHLGLAVNLKLNVDFRPKNAQVLFCQPQTQCLLLALKCSSTFLSTLNSMLTFGLKMLKYFFVNLELNVDFWH